MGDYLNLEGPNRDMPDIGSSTHIEVATHGDGTENGKIRRIPKASTKNVPLPVASTEVPAFEVSLPIEVDAVNMPSLSMSLLKLPKMR